MREATVAAGFARALFEFALAKGADREQLGRRSGFTISGMDDPDGRIAFGTYVNLMRAAREATGDPALALHFGQEIELAQVTLLGNLRLPAQPGLPEIASNLNHYARLVFDYPGAAERFQIESSGADVWIIDRRPEPNAFPELTESTFARMISGMRRFLAPSASAKRVHVTHPTPPYDAEYERVLQTPTIFASDRNAVVTDGAWLASLPGPQSGYAADLLTAHAERLLAKLDASRSVTGRVEAALIPLLRGGTPTADLVASQLGVSRQTLFRRLKAENTTFAAVLDALRHRLALDYLHDRRLSVSETAYHLGFSDPAAFSRAFKRWTGSSPGMARKNSVKAPARH